MKFFIVLCVLAGVTLISGMPVSVEKEIEDSETVVQRMDDPIKTINNKEKCEDGKIDVVQYKEKANDLLKEVKAKAETRQLNTNGAFNPIFLPPFIKLFFEMGKSLIAALNSIKN